MKGRILVALAALGLASLSFGSGQSSLLREVQQHLNLARQKASAGYANGALAHAAAVIPDRALRVRVDCSNIARASQGLYRNALNGAFMMWEQALGARQFEITETGPADIVVRFQSDVKSKGQEVCGHATWTRGVLNPDTDPTVVLTGQVEVRMFKPNGQPLTFEQLRACAAHELGHMLGLDDNDKVGGIMGLMDFNRPALSIEREEVEALLSAREEVLKIRRNFTYRSVRMNQ